MTAVDLLGECPFKGLGRAKLSGLPEALTLVHKLDRTWPQMNAGGEMSHVVAFRPGSGALAILRLIGIYAVLGGSTRLFAAYQIRRAEVDVRQAAGQLRPRPK